MHPCTYYTLEACFEERKFWEPYNFIAIHTFKSILKRAMRHICFCYEAIQILNNDVMSKTEATKYYEENTDEQQFNISKIATYRSGSDIETVSVVAIAC